MSDRQWEEDQAILREAEAVRQPLRRVQGFKSIGDILREMGDAAVVTDEDGGTHPIMPRVPSFDDLLDPRITPSREVAERLLTDARLALAKFHTPAREERFARQERQALRMLDNIEAKEVLQDGRPPGCWCLGRGWRRPLPQEDRPEYVGTLDAGDVSYPQVRPFEYVYCQCPEGMEALAEHMQRREAAEARVKQARLDVLWQRAGLPETLRGMTGKTWLEEIRRKDPHYFSQARSILAHLTEWEQSDAWLWIDGPWGRGKTVLMYLMALRESARGRTVLWQRTTTLLGRIRETFHPKSEVTTAQVLGSLIECDVLALDDVGKEYAKDGSDWVKEQFYTLIDARYSEGRRTLFTSNLAIDSPKLAERIDGASVERISQRCGTLGLIRLDGPNLRK